jgi:hypothetical protein
MTGDPVCCTELRRTDGHISALSRGYLAVEIFVVAVVSALSKVTDLILSVLNSAATGNGKQMEDGLFLPQVF